MINVEKTEIFGLERAKESAGLPKSNGNPNGIPKSIFKLGQSTPNSGHDCFLKGIIVQARITADHSFWLQWQRYHFQDVVSSTSKMHTILNMEPTFSPLVTSYSISEFKRLKAICLQENTPDNFERLIMNIPMGMLLTADITTNYLQLKTIYSQRKTHKMSSWKDYCKWIESLQEFMILTQRD